MSFLDKAKDLLGQHDEQVDQGLDKAGAAAGQKFGHENEIGMGVDQLQRMTGEGDTTAVPPHAAAEGEVPPPAAREGEVPPPPPAR